MDLVLRTADDLFLTDVVFPAFELGLVDAREAVRDLLRGVQDLRIRPLLESLLDGEPLQGGFGGLQQRAWLEAAYALLFSSWERGPAGWTQSEGGAGFAGDREQLLHLALMVDAPKYPYADPVQAKAQREELAAAPLGEHGLAPFLCGVWEPFPAFAPHQVLATGGGGRYEPEAEEAIADWSYRSAAAVKRWNDELPSKLARLLRRETERLGAGTLRAPEADGIFEFWTGKRSEPPMLPVAFSGLGPQAVEWIGRLGQLTALVRNAAAAQHALLCVMTPAGPAPGAG